MPAGNPRHVFPSDLRHHADCIGNTICRMLANTVLASVLASSPLRSVTIVNPKAFKTAQHDITLLSLTWGPVKSLLRRLLEQVPEEVTLPTKAARRSTSAQKTASAQNNVLKIASVNVTARAVESLIPLMTSLWRSMRRSSLPASRRRNKLTCSDSDTMCIFSLHNMSSSGLLLVAIASDSNRPCSSGRFLGCTRSTIKCIKAKLPSLADIVSINTIFFLHSWHTVHLHTRSIL